MSQSRALSVAEATVNVGIGWVVALATQLLTFPVLGLQVMLWQNFALSAVFTGVSLLRSYLVRRFFVRLEARG